MAKTNKPQLYLGNLAGPEGNAYVILGRAHEVAKAVGEDVLGASWEAIETEAKSKDYDHLLETINKYFEVI
jgi:hypothetical protein